MIKIIILLLGIAGGFGGGIYWAHHNPEAAAKISAEEEKRFLEAQLAITQKIQGKLESLQNKTASSKGNSFLGGGSGASAAEVNDVKADAQKQEAELKQKIAQLK
jgi:hypothetical protein